VELAAPGVGVLSTVPIGSQTAASVAAGAKSYEALPMELVRRRIAATSGRRSPAMKVVAAVMVSLSPVHAVLAEGTETAPAPEASNVSAMKEMP
jgi:hypothetical protein